MAAKSKSQKSDDIRKALLEGGIDEDVIDKLMSGVLSEGGLVEASEERGKVVGQALDQSIEAREDVGFDTGGIDVLNEAEKVAMEFMTGEIDPETKATVEQFSAEIAKGGGLGLSQAATNLTARDLGLTRLSLKQYGADIGTKLGDLKQRSMQFNQQARLQWAELETRTNQWIDKFALEVQTAGLQSSTFKLSAYQLISQNHNTAQKMINDLIMHNSSNKIEGLQQNIDTLTESFKSTNERISEAFGLSDFMDDDTDLSP